MQYCVIWLYVNLFKGETMTKCKRAGLAENANKFCLDICKYYEPTQNQYRQVERLVKSRGIKYEPANIQSTLVIQKATQRYYKLHGGNILDIETKTILDRELLLKMLD